MAIHMLVGLAAMDELEAPAHSTIESVVMMIGCLESKRWEDAEIARNMAASSFEAWLDKLVEINRKAAGWAST